MLQPALTDVQSNILKYHYRDYVRMLFVRFSGQSNSLKSWVSLFPDKFGISTAHTDLENYLKYKSGKRKTKNSTHCTLLFTQSGYVKMGFKKGQLGLPKDPAFWDGMAKRGTQLNDPDKRLWEPTYKKAIHALVILADDSEDKIELKKKEISDSLNRKKVGQIIFEESSFLLTNEEGQKVEHFGFRDGLSQPKLWNKDKLLEKGWKNVLEDAVGGSYLVYRKLEQNVKRFNENVQALSNELKLDPNYTAARMMGRYKNGEPLAKEWYAKKGESDQADPNGLKCPFHAHIRKMKPSTNDKIYPSIVRRGVPYDNRKDKSNSEPEIEVGLLFMCYQASIKNQFEYLQSKWANNPDFPEKFTGIDPVIGQYGSTTPKYRRGAYCTAKESARFSGAVSLKGGAYFFAPGIPFLKNIKSYPKPHPKKQNEPGDYNRKISFQMLMQIANSGKQRFFY